MTSKNLFLSVDIGTTVSKGIVIDANGTSLAQYAIRHSGLSPYFGWHEHDPERQWWSEFIEIVSKMLAQIPDRRSNIECVCVSGMFPTFCLADAQGVPLYNAVLYDDLRSAEIAREIDLHQNGNLYGFEIIPRILWFRKNLPNVWSRARKIFTTHNFIIFKLTGSYCLDSHTAYAFGGILDETTLNWKSNQLSEFNISCDLLPPIFTPRMIVGTVKDDAAKVTGLRSGVPVIAGTGDTVASILSSGAHKPGDCLIYYGSAGLLVKLTRDLEYLMGSTSFINGDEGVDWVLTLPKSGIQLEWLVSLLQGKLKKDIELADLENFDLAAARIVPRANSVMYFHDIFRQNKLIMTVNPLSAIIGSTLDTTPADIYRGALESFGFAMRRSIERYTTGGKSFNCFFAGGGGARSRIWREIVSDIISKQQFFSEQSAGAVGGAILAAYALNELDFNEFAEKQFHSYIITEPQLEMVRIYDEKYAYYCELSQALNSLNMLNHR